MKTIKIGLEYRKVFEVMKAGSVKKIVLGLMDVAQGKEPGVIPNAVIPTFMELKSQLGEEDTQATQAGVAGKPTELQVSAYMHYCLNLPEDVAWEEARKFVNYYDELGWMIRGKAIKRWDNCALGWVRRNVKDAHNEEDEGFEKVFKAYEDERVSCHKKVMALRNENDAVIKAENDACDKEAKVIGEERDALEREYRALAKRLKECHPTSGDGGCDGDEDERIRCKKEFRALERRRMALHGRGKALDERRKALIERSVNFLALSAMNLQGECIALEEEVALLDEIREAFKQVNYEEYRRMMPEITKERLKGVSFANREYEIIGGSLNDRESLKGTELDCLPPMEDAHDTNAKEGENVTKTGGINFPPEDWKVIDENWEELKDAVYRIKIKKEKASDIPLPVECWGIIDKYFDELAKLFHV